MSSDNPVVFAGQKAKLKVNASRIDGFAGEIPLVVTGLPPGVTARQTRIDPGSDEAEIEIDATEERAGAWASLSVRSSSAPRAAWRAIALSSGGGEGRHYGAVEGAMLAVVEKPKFSLECAATALNLVGGGTALLKVTIARSEGFAGPLAFVAINLPPGVSMELVEQGIGEATLRFRAETGAPPGRAARV